MKKRSIAARLGIAAMALTLITTSLSSGTLAKYTSTFNATASFKVAAWNVGAKFNGENAALLSKDVSLGNLAKSTDWNDTQNDTLAPGMSGTLAIDVGNAYGKAGGGDGTVGSDVAVDYKIYIQLTSANNLPTYFTMKADAGDAIVFEETIGESETPNPAYQDITGVNGLTRGKGYLVDSGDLKAGAGDGTKKTVNLKWEWPYESSTTSLLVSGEMPDITDTKEGVAAAQGSSDSTTQFKVIVVMTQKQPTKKSS